LRQFREGNENLSVRRRYLWP